MTEGLDQPTDAEGGGDHYARTRAKEVVEFEGVTKLQALQRVLYRSAKQDPTRRFHALYDKLARSDVMWQAWINVATNQGAPGIDGISIADITTGDTQGVKQFLDGVAEELTSRTYRPLALRRVHIPKAGRPGESRPLGIPTVRDRVVMAAAKIVLEPIFEADFSPQSFGFRPKRSAHQALEAIRVTANKGALWVLDADIKACFDEIDRDALIAQFERRVGDRQMVKLLRSWLRAGIFEGGVTTDTGAGTPQGSPLSPLLANIALHVLDQAWMAEGRRLGTLIRYCDDFVVLCATEERATAARDLAATTLAPLGLRLHPDKTRVTRLHGGHEGFDFLGFHHRMVESWKYRGRFYLQKWPSTRAMASIRAKVRERTPRRFVGRDLEAVVKELNPVLRGWGAYFRYGNSARKFALIDSYAHERLAMLACKKRGVTGRRWTTQFTRQWAHGLGIYQLMGTVRYGPAHAVR